VKDTICGFELFTLCSMGNRGSLLLWGKLLLAACEEDKSSVHVVDMVWWQFADLVELMVCLHYHGCKWYMQFHLLHCLLLDCEPVPLLGLNLELNLLV